VASGDWRRTRSTSLAKTSYWVPGATLNSSFRGRRRASYLAVQRSHSSFTRSRTRSRGGGAKDTFSGGEEFAYDLKALKRAIIVGETTGGGAHPTGPKRLDDHIGIMVPVERSINLTQTDWEGTGVEPDVKVPADRALERALELARAQVEAAKLEPAP
jgi:Peptidase family S41